MVQTCAMASSIAAVFSPSSPSGFMAIIAEIPWGTVLAGSTMTFLFGTRSTHCCAAMMMFLLLGRT